MKGIDIFCASQASTAICLRMDQIEASSSSSTIQLGGRTIDRHNPIICDSRRTTKPSLNPSCSSSQSPIDPQPYQKLHKKQSISSKPNQKPKRNLAKQKKSASDFNPIDDNVKKNSFTPTEIVKRSLSQAIDFVTPPGSSRYLLGDKNRHFFDGLPDFDPVLDLVTAENGTTKTISLNQNESSSSLEFQSSQSKPSSSNQVVVLRVSLHCKGCEGKVRKHLSRMEGVTSFNIDFAAKKVTIVGDVTPVSVLASVSKVKNAKFWPLSASSVGQTNKEISSK